MKLDTMRIKMIVAERGLTISELSGLCGISRQSISTILARGTCHPRNAGKLAKGLEVPIGEIVREG